jgi:hypothetical protein
MERLTQEERAEARARAGAATPGPYSVKIHSEDYGQGYGETTYFVDMGGALLKIGIGSDNKKCVIHYGNADFIAHAREDLPRALDDIDSLEAENAELRKRCEAAVEDLKSTNYDYMNHEDCPCRYCKHGHNSKCSLCDWDKNINAFEWRGPEGESDASDS